WLPAGPAAVPAPAGDWHPAACSGAGSGGRRPAATAATGPRPPSAAAADPDGPAGADSALSDAAPPPRAAGWHRRHRCGSDSGRTRHAVPLLVVPSHTPYHQADPPSFKDGAMRLSSSAVSAALPGFCVLYGTSAG